MSGTAASRGCTYLGSQEGGVSDEFLLRHRVKRRRATGVRHRRPARRGSTVRRQELSAIRGCGAPVATAPPRSVSRVQSCMATYSECLLRPRVGEGRDTMLRRGRCASLVSEAVHGRLGSSRVIKEQSEGHHRGGEERRASRCNSCCTV
jgi:hypothetical protein